MEPSVVHTLYKLQDEYLSSLATERGGSSELGRMFSHMTSSVDSSSEGIRRLFEQTAPQESLAIVDSLKIENRISRIMRASLKEVDFKKILDADLHTPAFGVFADCIIKEPFLREEVPFERMLVECRGKEESLSTNFVAMGHALEGIARTIIHLAQAGFKMIAEGLTGHEFEIGSEKHFRIAMAEVDGLQYSILATAFPRYALNRGAEHYNNFFLISDREARDADWGTEYKGVRHCKLLEGNYDRRHYDGEFQEIEPHDGGIGAVEVEMKEVE